MSEDTAIGLLFVGMLALGVVIISRADAYTGSLTTILFGDALGVDRGDLAQQAGLTAAVLVVSLLMYRLFLAFVAFHPGDEELSWKTLAGYVSLQHVAEPIPRRVVRN